MLEKNSGNTWEQLVEKIINSKLHLKAKFGWPNKLSLNEPWGHWVENNELTPVPSNTTYNLNLAEPAGDISMTLPDYIKFIKLNLQGIAGNSNMLKSSTYNFLHYGFKEYAIGWGNKFEKDIKLSEHAGSAGTYFCYTLIDGIKNKAYVIVTNSATENAQKGVFELLKVLQKN
jgi:D-alanyl-D-alanine carboxypeptidase